MDKLENKDMVILFGVIVAALLVILIAILGLEIPAVPVCVIVLIEVGIAACLHDVPIWLHGLVIIGQIAAGGLTDRLLFVVLCVVIYLLSILTLRFLRS